MFKEGPIRSLLKGQGLRPPSTWRDFERMSMDALPGEKDAYNLYIKLASIARELGQEDLAKKYEEIAKDEGDHYSIIYSEIIPAIQTHSRSTVTMRFPPTWRP